MTELSIIVATWNARKRVQECLTSLTHQELESSQEIIVIDNASTDGTRDLIRKQFPQVTLVHNDRNLGFAKANNIGIRLAKGKYLCLINSDVNVPTGCFVKMLRYMEENPSIGILGPKMLGTDGKVCRSCMRIPTLWNSVCRALALDSVFKRSQIFGGFLMNDFRHNRIKDVNILNGWFWMIRREAINGVGPLDERFFMYGEDLDWCRRFHQAGWRVVFYSEAEAVHYGGASSANAPIQFLIEMERANLQYWEKYHGQAARACYLLIIGLKHAIRACAYALLYLGKRSFRAQSSLKMKRSYACLLWLTGLKVIEKVRAR
jgi:GT2 family glycosyltransferase